MPFTGLVWIDDHAPLEAADEWRAPESEIDADLSDADRGRVERAREPLHLRDMPAGPQRAWCLELQAGRVLRAWIEVELEGGVRYSLDLERRDGAWRPAARDSGTWTRGAAPRALLPQHARLPGADPAGEPIRPTKAQKRAIQTDRLLKTFNAIMTDLEADGDAGMAALIERSGFSAPLSRRGRPRMDVAKAKRLRREGKTLQEVADEMDVDESNLRRALRREAH